jgi:hypothetical protein
MATTNSGHGLDTSGNVQVDFVWGNIPRQPNDLRTTLTDTATSAVGDNPVTTSSKRLVPGLDGHDAILGGWNGYPGYTPNDLGEFTGTAYNYTPYIVVPNVVGLNGTANAITSNGKTFAGYAAQDGLRDAGYQNANVKVNGTNRANTAISITNIARTAGSYDVTITGTGAVAQYPVGTTIVVSGTSTVDGTWTVKSVSSTNLVTFTSTANTVLSSGTGSVVGLTGTVYSQSVAPAANSITGTADITITNYA